jgi:hypothetical protein
VIKNEGHCKVNDNFISVSQIALAAAEQLKTARPAEVGFAPDVDIDIQELHEGSETNTFFRGEFHRIPKIKIVYHIRLQWLCYIIQPISCVSILYWLF